MNRSLVLAAHGSMAANNSNAPLFELARQIEKLNRFSVVTPAFLNGDPLMTDVLKQLPVGDVVVVPVMTSEGYYLRKLPEKFAENPNHSDFQLTITRVVGVHETIPSLVANRITWMLRQQQLPPGDTTVVVVGHGTRKNKNSGRSTIELTAKVANQVRSLMDTENDSLSGLKFKVCFLDQDPSIQRAARSIKTKNTLVIPFLISRGPHSTEDVPEAFGLPTGPQIEFPLISKNQFVSKNQFIAENQIGTCICDYPVGMLPGIAEICVDLAEKAIISDSSKQSIKNTNEVAS
jgi:sirohydrochlorin cobaltochelatase